MRQDCGESNDAHEDCGPYEVDDPPAPRKLDERQNIAGVHAFSGGM